MVVNGVSSYDVFISHKSEHKPWVVWLAEALKSCGRSVFLDIWSLIPGETWLEGLHRGLNGSRSAVLVATPEVVNSGWVREEYAILQRRRQAEPTFRLIPIVFGDIPNLPFLKNIQAVDFRDPARYRESLHQLLCGLEGREPGSQATLPCDIPPPPPLRLQSDEAPAPGEKGFLQRVVQRLQHPLSPPLMLLARGHRYQGPVIAALLEMLRARYTDEQLLHITPPYSDTVADVEYFQELGRQCRLSRETPDSTAFTAAFESRLHEVGLSVLVVTGFENANKDCRKQLAGALRSLTERHVEQLRVVLFGGQKLAAQRYGEAEISFLSHAESEKWPDPNVADVLAWQSQPFGERALTEDSAVALIQATGGHSGVIRWCLKRWESGLENPDWHRCVSVCSELYETWHRLKRFDAESLKGALGREAFGPALTWPMEPTTRQLYWEDLLTAREDRLVWRAEVIRQVGREVLA